MKLGPVLYVVAWLAAPLAMADGISFVFQDDYFTGTDRGYTDGTELIWSWAPSETNSPVIKSALGVRNRMYTPDAIDGHALAPTERPYAATLSLFYQIWRHEQGELVKYEIEAGVLGPHAYGEGLQSWTHRIINYTIPQGWDDQLHPDEPMLNFFMERWRPFGRIGDEHGWQARLDGVYGGALGTTFINGLGGICAKTGWNMPAEAAGGTVLANTGGDWFAFLFVEPRGRLVAHNATLGESMFHDRANERHLCPVVGEVEGGLTAGRGGLALTYSLIGSTREFEHQNKKQDYGNIRADYTWSF